MSRLSTRTLILVLSLTLIGCAPKVTIDFDKDVDFTQYRTYAWSAGTPAKNPLMDRRIIAAIDEQLGAKSFQKADTGPDMLVSYHAALTEEVYYNTTSVGYGPAWGPGYGWYGRGDGWGAAAGTSVTTPIELTIGTLTVDIYDAKQKQMVWRGSGSETVGPIPSKPPRPSTRRRPRCLRSFRLASSVAASAQCRTTYKRQRAPIRPESSGDQNFSDASATDIQSRHGSGFFARSWWTARGQFLAD